METLKFFNSKISFFGKRILKNPEIATKHSLASSITIENYDDTKIDDVLKSRLEIAKDKEFLYGLDLFNDIEFFTSISNHNTVFDNIHNCSLRGSKSVAKLIYSNPISDKDLLFKRIDTLKSIEHKYASMKDEINTHLKTMTDNEKFMIWILEEKEQNLKELYETVFFRLKALKLLNKYPVCLTSYNFYRMFISPLFGIVAPFLYFIVPYIVLLYRFKLKIPFKFYMKTIITSIFSSDMTLFGQGKVFKYIRIASYLFSAVFYLQGIFSSVDLSKTLYKISNILIGNLNGVIKYLYSFRKIHDILSIPTEIYFTNKSQSQDNQTIMSLNELFSLSGDFSIFKNFGKQLKAFKQLDLNAIKYVLETSYIYDCLLGAVKYKNTNNFGFADIYREDTKGRPKLELIDMIHPCLNNSKAVKNSVYLGSDNNEQNLIITSPNSSGKSILIKSIIVNVLMSQTMGITCCEKLVMTPFTFINTQINVPDSTGYESLFEAEMHRCKYNLDTLEKIGNKSSFSLIIMDEIFNSTNPIEAVAGAYAVCKKLSQYKNNILIFTTHYNYLTKLVKEKECMFANYRMEITLTGDDIHFTYKLQRGVNKHLLALELLRKNGFESSIIEEAIHIKNTLRTRRK